MKESPRSSRSSNSLLLVGRIGRAVGLKGEVEVAILSDAPDRFVPGSAVLGKAGELVVRRVRRQGERTIVAFDGIDDRTSAEALTGAELTIPFDQARELEADEYWDHDLVGCEVVTTTGEVVGAVTDVLHGPANDVLVVKGGREHLIPLTRNVVREVQAGVRITIEAIPGLLEE